MMFVEIEEDESSPPYPLALAVLDAVDEERRLPPRLDADLDDECGVEPCSCVPVPVLVLPLCPRLARVKIESCERSVA